MDQWDFKKWRKKLGINQVEAGKVLGLSRGAVQNWENETVRCRAPSSLPAGSCCGFGSNDPSSVR